MVHSLHGAGVSRFPTLLASPQQCVSLVRAMRPASCVKDNQVTVCKRGQKCMSARLRRKEARRKIARQDGAKMA